MCSFWNSPHRRRGCLSSSVTAGWVICRVVTHTCMARCAGCLSLRWTASCRVVSALRTSLDRPWKYLPRPFVFLESRFSLPSNANIGFQAVVSISKIAAVDVGKTKTRCTGASACISALAAPVCPRGTTGRMPCTAKAVQHRPCYPSWSDEGVFSPADC